ncbi:hypothetical protein, partial [Thiolapillus sp.]|uniref:hypothetical protein n=1 Tax=Thiolapillus sp. TaxID=2017437 RepID=UPI0025EE7F07
MSKRKKKYNADIHTPLTPKNPLKITTLSGLISSLPTQAHEAKTRSKNHNILNTFFIVIIY